MTSNTAGMHFSYALTTYTVESGHKVNNTYLYSIMQCNKQDKHTSLCQSQQNITL